MKENKTEKSRRVYVCHTYYHIYVTLLKELNFQHQDKTDRADIILSRMSPELLETDFINRLRESAVFEKVLLMNERRDSEFPELQKYRKSSGGFFAKMLRRMILSKKFPKKLEDCIDVDFAGYKDIYVYCDEDPIGYYLNYKKIRYHAVEDGLDCNKDFDTVIHFNQKFWPLKRWMAKKGLIFLENGYSRYAVDMEVNDLSCIAYKHAGWKEVPRKLLKEQLSDSDKETIFAVFIKNADVLIEQCSDLRKENVLILTQPLCSMDIRQQIFEDIIEKYAKGAQVLIKPHPRDTLDYKEKFKECLVLEQKFPVEVLNFRPEIRFKKVISVITTAIDAIEFADEKINLGPDFLDLYEEPEKHRY